MKINPASTFSNATEVVGPGDYFVSAIDADQFFLMAGPYSSHALAASSVEAARRLTCDNDARAHFMAWGVCRLDPNSGRIGSLNRAGLIQEESHEG